MTDEQIQATIERLCCADASTARRERWMLLREHINGERTDKTAAHWALTDLLSDLGQALAFVSIEGWELLELRASLQKGERAT